MLAVTLHRLHAPARERAADPRGRDAFVDDRVLGDVGLDYLAALRNLVRRASRGFDLGQLRHSLGLPGAQPSPSCRGAPPSITMVSPFMNDEAAEARKMHG